MQLKRAFFFNELENIRGVFKDWLIARSIFESHRITRVDSATFSFTYVSLIGSRCMVSGSLISYSLAGWPVRS